MAYRYSDLYHIIVSYEIDEHFFLSFDMIHTYSYDTYDL